MAKEWKWQRRERQQRKSRYGMVTVGKSTKQIPEILSKRSAGDLRKQKRGSK